MLMPVNEMQFTSTNLVSELEKIAKDRHAGNLGQAFDLGNVSAVEISNDQIDNRNDGDGDCLDSHGAGGDDEKVKD